MPPNSQDFVLSEEVSAVTPSGTHFHMGVYDISDRDHVELQNRRNDFESLSVYLGERRLLFSINHVFSSLTGNRTRDDFDLFGTRFPAVEILNGQMPPLTNRAAREFARRLGKPGIAGSDAHTLEGLGSAYTEVKGARTKEEFFAGLRMNLGRSKGTAGGWWKLTSAVLDIGAELMRVTPWTRILAPLMIAAPAAVAVQQAREIWFARNWRRKLGLRKPAQGKPFGLGRPAWEA